jgi:hypothetical protein
MNNSGSDILDGYGGSFPPQIDGGENDIEEQFAMQTRGLGDKREPNNSDLF